jgi:hypothetical protein
MLSFCRTEVWLSNNVAVETNCTSKYIWTNKSHERYLLRHEGPSLLWCASLYALISYGVGRHLVQALRARLVG